MRRFVDSGGDIVAARMALHLHHIFVCTSAGAPKAQTLLDAGFVEGAPNVHPGQGTANRRFFFESGYLELLWVQDEREARSALTAPTKLWDRWVERRGTANPFGMCFSSSQLADSVLPFTSWAYRPLYLSEGRYIQFADELPLSEPEVFALSWPQCPSSPEDEPTTHSLGLREMRSVSVGLPDPTAISDQLRKIRDAGLIRIHQSIAPELVIGFTSQQEVEHCIPALGLSLVGRPDSAA
jgi:hypothetical protein